MHLKLLHYQKPTSPKDGQTFTATEWARKLGLGKDTIHRRLRKGWSIEECFSNKKKNQFG